MARLYYKTYSDTELIRLISSNDHPAYMEVYERYSRLLIYRPAKSLTIRKWQNRASLKPETSLPAYLYAALRYKIIDRITRKKVEASYFESLAAFDAEDTISADYLIREKELGSHFTVADYQVISDTYNGDRYPSDHLPVSSKILFQPSAFK